MVRHTVDSGHVVHKRLCDVNLKKSGRVHKGSIRSKFMTALAGAFLADADSHCLYIRLLFESMPSLEYIS